ncbi:2402_t:CDS:2 [Ambispora gerdemannii]|uniref:2402_t:CDS:1 n=1 Tax=Ambispora gerdemannii TaxID=144530 RepID=A0A9N9AEH1_9GLOM|nr:2402_t:CDS:2 [Ambispora gerdemannii]
METYFGYVKTPQDAILLFEACRMGYLARIQRRLSERERSAIRSGSVFVWDEREAGMRRWTDGKSWSASRVSGSFLTYRELESKRKTNSRGSNNPNDLSSEDTDSSESYSNSGKKIASTTEQCRYKHGGLVKQSFSITTNNHQKLHLICYYTKADVIGEKLQIPLQDEKLKIPIPKGMYPETQNVDGSVGPHGGHYPDNRLERSLSPSPYSWQLPQPAAAHLPGSLPNTLLHGGNNSSHAHHQHRHSSGGQEPMQIDTPHSACSTPSISSSPSTIEEDFNDYHRRQNPLSAIGAHLGSNSNGSSISLPSYPPANYIQSESNSTTGATFSGGSQPINIPAPGRYVFPPPQQAPFPSSYPPHSSSHHIQQSNNNSNGIAKINDN